jgi:small subunit ribosomal protein S2
LQSAEANKLGIPIMALVDTNCDPDPIDYVIACNDDALKSIKLILQALMQAIVAQKGEMQVALVKGDKDEEAVDLEASKEFVEALKEATEEKE